jgi:hypothetical protein
MEIIITIKIVDEQKPTKPLIQIWSEKLDNWIKEDEENKE